MLMSAIEYILLYPLNTYLHFPLIPLLQTCRNRRVSGIICSGGVANRRSVRRSSASTRSVSTAIYTHYYVRAIMFTTMWLYTLPFSYLKSCSIDTLRIALKYLLFISSSSSSSSASSSTSSSFSSSSLL